MKKNHELFWILEVLFLTPVALFWLGIMSMYLGSTNMLASVIGGTGSEAKILLITIICPLAASYFANKYINDNKKEKGAAHGTAKIIRVLGLLTVALVILYLYILRQPV
ncbi:MAG TPA: hypothetical protein VHE53_05300 [Patescibacteria group bacterium]|nr:hypothetical protein [Patescibacteria group bacterium]